MQSVIFKMKTSLAEAHSVSDFVRSLNLKRGVTGYSLHVVPVALYAWLRHPDEFRTALAAALDCGGDRTLLERSLGRCRALSLGKTKMQLNGLLELGMAKVDFSCRKLLKDYQQNSSGKPVGSIGCFWPGIVLRNVIFIFTVLVREVQTTAPPYKILCS